MHLVLPEPSAGLLMILSMVDEAALPGPLRLTSVAWEDPQAMMMVVMFGCVDC